MSELMPSDTEMLDFLIDNDAMIYSNDKDGMCFVAQPK